MEVVLGGLRQSFETLQREGAVTLKGDLPEVNCVIEVTKEFDVVIRFDFEGLVGGWAERMGLLRVGLPFNVEGEVPDGRPTPLPAHPLLAAPEQAASSALSRCHPTKSP